MEALLESNMEEAKSTYLRVSNELAQIQGKYEDKSIEL